jgi:dTDP-4-dehydrorhamnose reductase
MRRALIGSTGFLGTALQRQAPFDDLYASANIHESAGRAYDLVVCAAPSAWKWRANQDPEGDRAHVQALIEPLRLIRAERFVLISTADVHGSPVGVDEETPVDPASATPYGRHRFALEEAVRRRFPRACVVRLAHPFGEGLKKNFLYDLIHRHRLDLTHAESRFQFYPVSRLWRDIGVALEQELPLLHLPTEPATAREIASSCFSMTFDHVTAQPPARYDMRSRHGRRLGWGGPYCCGKDEVFQAIREFAQRAPAVAP